MWSCTGNNLIIRKSGFLNWQHRCWLFDLIGVPADVIEILTKGGDAKDWYMASDRTSLGVEISGLQPVEPLSFAPTWRSVGLFQMLSLQCGCLEQAGFLVECRPWVGTFQLEIEIIWKGVLSNCFLKICEKGNKNQIRSFFLNEWLGGGFKICLKMFISIWVFPENGGTPPISHPKMIWSCLFGKNPLVCWGNVPPF